MGATSTQSRVKRLTGRSALQLTHSALSLFSYLIELMQLMASGDLVVLSDLIATTAEKLKSPIV